MDYGTIKLISVLTAYISRVIEVKRIFYVFYICFVLIRFMINDRIDRSIEDSCCLANKHREVSWEIVKLGKREFYRV